MARRVITASLTFSNNSNANSALSRINSALASYSYAEESTDITTGVSRSGSVVNISISIEDRDIAFEAAESIMAAILAGSRHTSGGWSVNRI